ncbi:hypothetical protein TREPR_0883 [Treponema primitia ZAS-2]|uniref:Uncharacterized protein n=1 Tax=Treponema primitia (strain ATCC BAA-887 / DSM 12427 / ZAS-2) TaxID=545694 RepID=F5YIL4_TREPZ|nr:hypothetical protein [Treponema primitia]AEF84562.1 hypothetical protein TREPR_0883 [Treponema primitia ZAS-2]
MNNDKSKKALLPEADVELDSMIDRVIREQSVIGNNAAADALRPLVNLITASLPHTDSIDSDAD